MTKKIRKLHAKDHLGDIKMSFLAAMVSGIDKHLSTPKGTIMFSRLNDKKKNERFQSHILNEFAKRSASTLDHIEHESVLAVAEKFQKKYHAAASKQVLASTKLKENFNHHDMLNKTFNAFEKVHNQLLDKI